MGTGNNELGERLMRWTKLNTCIGFCAWNGADWELASAICTL